jgi:hypothetical protein
MTGGQFLFEWLFRRHFISRRQDYFCLAMPCHAPTPAQSDPIASLVVLNQAETTPGAQSASNGPLGVELYSLFDRYTVKNKTTIRIGAQSIYSYLSRESNSGLTGRLGVEFRGPRGVVWF